MALKERVVIVGLGSIGIRHARLLSERPDVSVEYCDEVSSSLDRATSALGERRSHRSFDDMLTTLPDHVLIASPHNLHVAQAKAALSIGANVLCEKPVSDYEADVASLATIADTARGVLTFGFHLHFHPAIRRIRELATSGRLGALAHFSAHVGSHITLVNSASRYQAEMRGSLLLDYTHQADLAFLLLGQRPSGVYAIGLDVPGQEFASSPNVVSMICDYPGPIGSMVHLNYLQDPDRDDCELVGTAGWAKYDWKEGLLRWGVSGLPEVSETIRSDRDDVYRAEHQAFLDAARGIANPESPLRSAVVSLEVAHAALKSIDSGKRVALL